MIQVAYRPAALTPGNQECRPRRAVGAGLHPRSGDHSPGVSMRQRAEGDRVACPGEVLPFDVAAGARRGDHVVSALVDSHVVDVAVRIAVDVEEHQVTAPGLLFADWPELEELGLRGALDALAE